MIVDLHTHLWQSPEQLGEPIVEQMRRRYPQQFGLLDASPQAHEVAMQPIDVAVVLGFRAIALGADVPNTFIAEYVAQRPDRVIGFAGIDPTEPGCVTQLRELPDMGLSGLTISPASQGFHPSDTRAMKVYEVAQEMGLPVLLHQGTHHTANSRMAFAQPYLFDDVAREFPDLKMVVAHVGYPWIDQTLTLIGKHPNVYAEISNVISRPLHLYQTLQAAHQLGVCEKLLFGSDFPYLSPTEAIEIVYSMNNTFQSAGLPGVPREKLRAIIERDSLECLGLQRGAPVARDPEPAAEAEQATETAPLPAATPQPPVKSLVKDGAS